MERRNRNRGLSRLVSILCLVLRGTIGVSIAVVGVFFAIFLLDNAPRSASAEELVVWMAYVMAAFFGGLIAAVLFIKDPIHQVVLNNLKEEQSVKKLNSSESNE